MDFFALNKDEYRNYLHSVRKLMESKKYKKEGVAFLAIEEMPEFENSLTKIQIESVKDVSPEVFAEFCEKYSNINKVFSERFNQFFARCVKDTNIKDDIEYELGSVKEYVKAFVSQEKETYENLVNSTEKGSTSENMKAFANVLNNKDLDIENTIEQSRVRSYS